jgi:hypothetical protein
LRLEVVWKLEGEDAGRYSGRRGKYDGYGLGAFFVK